MKNIKEWWHDLWFGYILSWILEKNKRKRKELEGKRRANRRMW